MNKILDFPRLFSLCSVSFGDDECIRRYEIGNEYLRLTHKAFFDEGLTSEIVGLFAKDPPFEYAVECVALRCKPTHQAASPF